MTPTKRFIVKVELKVSVAGGFTVLVYNQNRSIEMEQPAHPKFIEHFIGTSVGFYWAEMAPYGLAIKEAAPWQGW